MPYESSSAASDVSLAPVGSRIIRAMQLSAARGKTAECVAKREPASTVSGERSDRQLSAGASWQTGGELTIPANAHLANLRSLARRAG